MNVYKLNSDGDRKWVKFFTVGGVVLGDYSKNHPLFASQNKLPVERNPEVKGKNAQRAFADFSNVNYEPYPCFSGHAKSVLGPHLEGLGQWLELEFDEAPYWLFNVTNIVDALNEPASQVSRFTNGKVMFVEEFVFKPEALTNQLIFKIPQRPGTYTFATNRFVDLVEQHQLTGFVFKPLWSQEGGTAKPSASDPTSSTSQPAREVDELEKSVSRLDDRPLSETEHAELALRRDRAFKYLQIADSRAAPETIVKIVDSYIERWQRDGPMACEAQPAEPDAADVALEVGAVWGEQFIRRFDWQWLSVRHAKGDDLAVASPDRSLVVYPARFVRACLREPDIDCTAMLAFNMLAAGNISAMSAGRFQDLMLGVRRVIPK